MKRRADMVGRAPTTPHRSAPTREAGEEIASSPCGLLATTRLGRGEESRLRGVFIGRNVVEVMERFGRVAVEGGGEGVGAE